MTLTITIRNTILFFISSYLFFNQAIATPIYCPEEVSTTTDGHTIHYYFKPSNNTAFRPTGYPPLPKNKRVYWSSANTHDPDIGFADCVFTDNMGHFYNFTYNKPPLFADNNNGNHWVYDEKNKKYECKGGTNPYICPFTTVEPSINKQN